MNEIVNNFLSPGDKFITEMHLWQPGVTYSASHHLRIESKEKGVLRYIYQNKLDQACFQHDMAYGDFKELTRRTASNNILRDEAFNFAKNPKYDGYQGGLALMIYKCFDKKASSGAIKNENMWNKELPGELHKLAIGKFNKRKLHWCLIANIWRTDLADI